MSADQRVSDRYVCEDCGWTWPLSTPPPDDAECDNCGGELEKVDRG